MCRGAAISGRAAADRPAPARSVYCGVVVDVAVVVRVAVPVGVATVERCTTLRTVG